MLSCQVGRCLFVSVTAACMLVQFIYNDGTQIKEVIRRNDKAVMWL